MNRESLILIESLVAAIFLVLFLPRVPELCADSVGWTAGARVEYEMALVANRSQIAFVELKKKQDEMDREREVRLKAEELARETARARADRQAMEAQQREDEENRKFWEDTKQRHEALLKECTPYAGKPTYSVPPWCGPVMYEVNRQQSR